MARTTLALNDDLLEKLKQRAAAERRPMQDVVNDILRHALAKPGDRPRYRLQMRGWKAELQSGVDILDRDRLLDLLDGTTP